MYFDTFNTLNEYAFKHRKIISYSCLQEYPINPVVEDHQGIQLRKNGIKAHFCY